jgi:hypothetical protein
VILTLNLPRLSELMTTARVDKIHAEPGTLLEPGAALIDLRVDLSEAFAHDCPPISRYRIVLRERAWLRDLSVAHGAEIDVDAPLARFSTQDQEALQGQPSRRARVAIAGIVGDDSAWHAEAS